MSIEREKKALIHSSPRFGWSCVCLVVKREFNDKESNFERERERERESVQSSATERKCVKKIIIIDDVKNQ